LRAFAVKTTRNLAMKRLTRQSAAKRQGITVSFEELNQCIPDGNTVEQALEGKELSRVLDAFLDTLALEDRNLFLRRYWFFDSIKELSRLFGITEGHVKIKLYRM
jgi:RNA polymerase sigma-70 factor (ECF subfamily)